MQCSTLRGGQLVEGAEVREFGGANLEPSKGAWLLELLACRSISSFLCLNGGNGNDAEELKFFILTTEYAQPPTKEREES